MSSSHEPVVYINGEFVPEGQAIVSVFDRGFRWGDGMYEMSRTFGGKLFRLGEHLERQKWSLRYGRIDLDESMSELEAATEELVARNKATGEGADDLGVTHIISRGLLDPTRRAATRPTVVVNTDTLALMLDYDGNVTESPGANFLFLSQGRLCVPNRRNVLGGVSMDFVLKLAEGMGVPAEEGDYTPFDVYGADEAFLTTTPYYMASVISLNGLAIGRGTPGPFYQQLMQAWSERVGLDIIDHAQSHGTD